MVFRLLFPVLFMLGALAGCAVAPPQEGKDAPFLAPAAGGNIAFASAAAAPRAGRVFYPSWRIDGLRRFTKWTNVLARMDDEDALPPQWRKEERKLASLPVSRRARMVNDLVNSYRYIGDGAADHWDTPGEFFARGGGDCEDFAIAKYAMLRDLGVPEDDLRIAVVYDRTLKEMHALLTVQADDEMLLLDNQITAVRADRAADRYRPVFGLGRGAWWLYDTAGLV